MAYHVRLSLHPGYHPTIEIDDCPPPGLARFDYLNTGKPASAEDVPKRVRILSAHKRVPDVFAIRWYWGVNWKFQALVEAREPGLHQFFPVELRYKDGRIEEGPLYLFNICRRMDAMIFEKSSLSWSKDGRPSIRLLPGILVHDRAAIAGCHVWRGDRLGSGRVFFSDDLYQAFKKEKLKAVQAFPTLEEYRDGSVQLGDRVQIIVR